MDNKIISKNDIDFLNDLRNFLIYIGFGHIYGILGHDSGGILSHDVLCNDPYCYNVDSKGNKIPSNLKGDDYDKVESVYNDIVSIISKARDDNYVDKLLELIERLKKNAK